MKQQNQGGIRRIGILAVAVFVAVVAAAGCGKLTGGTTDGAKTDAIILYAGDAGALGCLGLVTAGKPGDVDKARLAAACAETVLVSDLIDVNAVAACAAKAGVPAKYQALVGVVIERVKAHTGGISIVPKGSVESEALKAFLSTCRMALG